MGLAGEVEVSGFARLAEIRALLGMIVGELLSSLRQVDDEARQKDSASGDVFLGSHPFINKTLQKYERRQKGEQPDPFIDPEERPRYLRKLKADYEKLPADK